jgi:hypothetical protein
MKIIAIYFITSVFITMLILYIIQPEPLIIVKYPSPLEEVSDVYIDDNDVCYRYYREEYKNNN